METGNVIKEYRKLRNMTQEELAAALLVTPQAVSRWKTGISYPDITMIPEIVKALGVSADELLGCDNAAQDAGKEQTSMLDYQELVASVQVLEVIKKEYPQIKVIMLSAICGEAVVKDAMELGADGFVAKPFQASSLLERIS